MMNERIQKLAIDCAIQLDWDFPSDPKEYTFSSAGVEKFAELIVRECCDIITLYNIKDDMMFDMPPVYVIKKHFGVK